MPSQNVLPIDRAPENRFSGLGPDDLRDEEIDSLLDLALKVLAHRHRRGEPLTSPEASRAYLRLKIGERKFEVFACVFVDNRHRIIAFEELFQGTIDGASVHPRVVVQKALEINAAAVIFAHNHPSGVAEPSMADQRITQRLKDALALIDVRVLDHFIVTAEDSVSFAERSLL
ncbi:MAG: DNA repair protein RadC [Pseudomonadota bacterium]|nr:DNA repair protein RadC [Pseudomonadota bacterium]